MISEPKPKPPVGDGKRRVASLLADLRTRLPDLAGAAGGGEISDDAARELKALVTDAGRALRRLRHIPRADTAPLEKFRAACRDALNALRMKNRAASRLEAAQRRLERLS